MRRPTCRQTRPSLTSWLSSVPGRLCFLAVFVAGAVTIPIVSTGSARSSSSPGAHGSSVGAAVRPTSSASRTLSTNRAVTSRRPIITMSPSSSPNAMALARYVLATYPLVSASAAQPPVLTSLAWQKVSLTLRAMSVANSSTTASPTIVSVTPVPPAISPVTTPVTTTRSASTAEIAAVAKIAFCEEGGGWFYSGPAYPDSVGITATNWFGNGGGSCVTDVCQTQVELAFAARYLGGQLPDQNGCGGGY